MSKRFLPYIILWVSFQLLVVTSFNPLPRAYHTATYMNNRLYILGGLYTPESVVQTNEFFYLNFSESFNTKSLSWRDLSKNTIPVHNSAATVVGGASNNSLFLYGGNTTISTMAFVYKFDPINETWSTPTIAGAITARKQSLTGIVNNKGKMYLWGGSIVGKENVTVNDMLILDTVNLSWGKGTFVDAPTSRFFYGAVILPNQTIIYMGGYDSVNVVQQSLKQVYMYDTINDNWSVKPTLGNVPIGRDSFTAVLGLDGQRIIIFGGIGTNNVAPLSPGDALHELNLNTLVWSTPNVTGNIPSSRMFHKANVIRKYMVISFGFGYDQLTESDILLLDISNNDNYIWTNIFDPSALLSPPSKPSLTPISPISPISSTSSTSESSSKSIMIVTIVVSLFVGVLLSFGSFFFYKWNKNKQYQKNTIILIPGSSDYETNERDVNDHKQEILLQPPTIN